MNYDAIIGLEIHAELKTKSKMFCGCDNDSLGKAPNSNVCPICLGHPGTLPVPNKQAINWTILAGLALKCQISRLSKFDRKNYFYPDLPKGYQISQYDQPLAYNGHLRVDETDVLITRIHLEEDTGKSIHINGQDETLLDFNRAGTPLIELVTEPVVKDAAMAKKFAQSYQQILRYLDISNADMEKGEMRCEANVSVQAAGSWEYKDGEIKAQQKSKTLNPKVEVKNINSFRALEKAINFEIARQTEALEKGEKILAETRGWDENLAQTFSQRSKESSAEYRYFPEPDIPPLKIDDNLLADLRASLPELPPAKKLRFMREYGLSSEIADIIINDKALAAWTEQVISELNAWIEANGDEYERQSKRLAQTAANWLVRELTKRLKRDNLQVADLKITAENFAELVCLIYQEKINSTTGQKLLEKMYNEGGDPTDIMTELGWEQIDNSAELEDLVKKIIHDHPVQAEQYRSGKINVAQFFIGQVMAASRGQANPKIVKELLEKFLNDK